MILTPFDLYEVKWLKFHFFYELCGYKGIGTRVGKHECQLQQERERNEFFTTFGAKSTHEQLGW